MKKAKILAIILIIAMIGFSLSVTSCRKDPLAPLMEVIPDDDDNGNGEDNGGSGTDNSPYNFEVDEQGWAPSETTNVVRGAVQTTEKAKLGDGSLKIHAVFSNGVTTTGVLDVDAGGIDLSSNPIISLWMWVPAAAYGTDEVINYHYFQIFIQSGVGWTWYDSGMSCKLNDIGNAGTWVKYEFDVSAAPAPGDLTDVKAIGLKFMINPANTTTFDGSIYLDAVNWDPVPVSSDPSLYGFEFNHQGWGDAEMDGGFKSRVQTMEKAYIGAGSLKIHCELTNNVAVNNIGNIKVEPGGLNFTGSTSLVYWLWIPLELYGSDPGGNPNQINLYIQSGGWIWSDIWINLNNIADADKWTKYTYDLSGANDIANIQGIGFKLSLNASNPTTFNGDIYLDAVDTEP